MLVLLFGLFMVELLFCGCGVGCVLMECVLKDVKVKGYCFVLLVGDEFYYSCVGFKLVLKGCVIMLGLVDVVCIFVFEFVDGVFDGVFGMVVLDWSKVWG